MPKFYIGRASVKMDMDKLDDAILDLNEAIHLPSKNFSEAFRVRGEAKRLKNDLAGAMADDDQAILLSPRDELAYVNRALVFRDKQDYTHAIADLDQAIVINPKSDLAYSNRAQIQPAERRARSIAQGFGQSGRNDTKITARAQSSPRRYVTGEKNEFDKAIQDYNAANHFVSDFATAFVGPGTRASVSWRPPRPLPVGVREGPEATPGRRSRASAAGPGGGPAASRRRFQTDAPTSKPQPMRRRGRSGSKTKGSPSKSVKRRRRNCQIRESGSLW